jgi:hypothetical protein
MSRLTERQLLLLQQQCQQATPSPYAASSQCSSRNRPRSISGFSYSNVGSRPRSSSCSGRPPYPLPPHPLHPASYAGLAPSTYKGTLSATGGTNGPFHAPSNPQNTTAYRDRSAPGCVTSGNAHSAASLRVASEAGLGYNHGAMPAINSSSSSSSQPGSSTGAGPTQMHS